MFLFPLLLFTQFCKTGSCCVMTLLPKGLLAGTSVWHHAWLFHAGSYLGCPSQPQAHDPPSLASWIAGIIGVRYSVWHLSRPGIRTHVPMKFQSTEQSILAVQAPTAELSFILFFLCNKFGHFFFFFLSFFFFLNCTLTLSIDKLYQ